VFYLKRLVPFISCSTPLKTGGFGAKNFENKRLGAGFRFQVPVSGSSPEKAGGALPRRPIACSFFQTGISLARSGKLYAKAWRVFSLWFQRFAAVGVLTRDGGQLAAGGLLLSEPAHEACRDRFAFQRSGPACRWPSLLSDHTLGIDWPEKGTKPRPISRGLDTLRLMH